MGLSYTVSGSVAHFRTPSRVPIESLKFHFLPKQEGTGDPSPSNVRPITGWTGLNGRRSGKNLFNYNEDNLVLEDCVNSSGTTLSRQIYHTGITNCKVTLSAHIKEGYTRPSYSLINIGVCENGTNSIAESFIASIELNKTMILSSSQELILVSTSDSAYTANAYFNRYDIQIEVGSNATDYEAHQGTLIPITFPNAGKNRLDPSSIIIPNPDYVELVSGIYKNKVTDTKSSLELCVQLYENQTDFIKTAATLTNVGTGRQSITFYIDDPDCRYIMLKHNGTKRDFKIMFPCDASIYYGAYTLSVKVNSNNPKVVGGVQLTEFQLEAGQSATSYEPYSSDTTFYGGYIDPVAGEIVAEYKKHVFDGVNMRIVMNYKVSGKFYGLKSVSDCQYGSNGYVISNMLKSQINHGNNVCSPRPSDSGYLFDFDLATFCDLTTEQYDALTIQEQTDLVNDYLADLYENGTPLIIVYKLITPIHIPIAPQAMKAYLDHNNFWSDANDITEVTYPIVESKDIFDARKRIMSNTWNMLPLSYMEVEYISAKDSNPYINMGIYYTGEVEAEVHYYNDKAEAFLFGARKGSSLLPYCNFNIESGNYNRSRLDYGNTKGTNASGLVFNGVHDGEYVFKFHNRIATVKNILTGDTVTSDFSDAKFNSYSDYSMLLFSVMTNGSPSLTNDAGELRVYSAKFWIGGQLVRDLVPCFRKSDNKPGMYDRVSKTFFTNVGSGEFLIP